MAYHDLFDCKEGKKSNIALDFLDGEQEEWMTRIMNDPAKGRKHWKEKGMIVRYRNITNMIIEKSGMLFNDSTPTVELYSDKKTDSVDEASSTRLQELFDKSDWVENFINIDTAVRLLKTVLVLVQYDPLGDKLFFDVLHRGNSGVLTDPITREINTLVYKLGETDDELETFRVMTKDLVETYSWNEKTNLEILLDTQPNLSGIIPVIPFHDTKIPRNGFWNPLGYDLVQLNEIYNLHLIDSEYAASWSKLKTLFTNADVTSTGDENRMEVAEIMGSPSPRQIPAQGGMSAGPGNIIKVDAGTQTPFVEYLGPDIDLQPIDDMFARWINDFASDWSVNVKSGNGKANSGFQLVVEEIDNLQLRQRRQRMFEAGFHRLYEVIATITGMNEELDLYVTFSRPALPVDPKAAEETWDMRIAGGRASIIDYLMETKNLTRDEAVEAYQQIQEDNSLTNDTESTDTAKTQPVSVQNDTTALNNTEEPTGMVD